MNSVQIKVTKNMSAYKVGDIITVPIDEKGTPKSLFWRRRLKDAKMDGCCEIVRPVTNKIVIKKETIEDGESE
jgi:flagellar basal body L-ring protein FlgH